MSGLQVAAYDPELYLRWVQWGAHSPILRTHPQPDPHVERRAWGYNLPVSGYMRAAFARRARLVPALFTANHDFETTAIAALRYRDSGKACAHALLLLDTAASRSSPSAS